MQGGFSLIELQVALVVAALVALAIFGLFRAGMALGRRTTQTVAAGDAALGLEVIARTILEASRDPEAFRLWPVGSTGAPYDAVVFRVARTGPDGFRLGEEGQPDWAGWAGFTFDPAGRVVRLVEFLGTEEPPAPPWNGGRLVVRQVRRFVVERKNDRFAIVLQIESKDSTMTLQTEVWPRNR